MGVTLGVHWWASVLTLAEGKEPTEGVNGREDLAKKEKESLVWKSMQIKKHQG